MRHRSTRGFRNILLTTTALVAALSGGGKGAGAAGSSSGLSGMQVQSGTATLSTPTATKSIITQSTSKAIISWSAFGIPAGSSVQFIQPGASSVALNRVSGGSVSQIMGSLSANGQVWIVNPAGVFFGPGAQVDVAGLMATTSDIKNGDFLSGTYQFGIGSSNPTASIVNQGHIKVAPGGSAVLAGARVDNQGLIEAQLGSVVLGGAKTFAVDFQGDKLLSFQVTGAVDQRPQEATGSPAAALVTNEGTVRATGGTVLITARAAKNIIDNVINSSGIVEAQSAKLVNGEIILDGGDTGAVRVTGSLDASGPGTGETGGTVKVLGNQVALAAGATIDVSGEAGGGTALIGGNFHGSGPEANAATTTISAGARINASALTKGNGGKVALWSDTLTTFAGTITATGGSLGGNGGYVETSGKSLSIGATAKVDTSAAKGIAGTWLLDPADFTIDSTQAGVISADLTSGSNVIVETSPADTNSGTGGIVVNAPIIYASANDLSLLAVGDITVNASILNTSSGGAVNLVAGWNGTTGFAGSPGVNTSVSPAAAMIAAIVTGPNAFGQTLGAATGSVFINGTAGGVAVGSARGPTTVLANNVTLQGGSASGASAQIGFNPVVASTIVSTSGAINVTALGNVSVLAGTAQAAFAQIGHGGFDAYSGSNTTGNPLLTGDILVHAGGTVLLQGSTSAGASQAFAQIGNGGYNVGRSAAVTGTLTVGGSIAVTGGGVSLLGGAGTGDFVQIGHGGALALLSATVTGGVVVTGNISVGSGADVSVVGGTASGAFAQIGHGGRSALALANVGGGATLAGYVSVNAGGSVMVAAGTAAGSYKDYAQIGHGGESFGYKLSASSVAITGGVGVTAAGNISVLGGAGTGTYANGFAFIGLGGDNILGTASLTGGVTVLGNVTAMAGGSLTVMGGVGNRSFAQVGNGGRDFGSYITANSISIAGSVTNTAAGNITVQAGPGSRAFAQIGNGGRNALGGGTTSFAHVTGISSVTGDIFVNSTGGSISVIGGSGDRDPAQIGNGGAGFGYALRGGGVTFGGNVTATALGAITVQGGAGTYGAFAQIGHGGRYALQSAVLTGGVAVTGTVAVDSASSSIVLAGGTANGAFAQIGHGGGGFGYRMSAASVDVSGGVGATAQGDISVLGGTGSAAFAEIGNGGFHALESAHLSGGALLLGDVAANSTGTIAVSGGTGNNSFAMIGTGGRDLGAFMAAASAEISGNVTAGGASGVSLLGGGGTASGVMIGLGGHYAFGAATLAGGGTMLGNITVRSTSGSISMLGGGYRAFAQIGAGGLSAFESASLGGGVSIASTLAVTANGSISVSGGTDVHSFAMIGDGGLAFGYRMHAGSASIAGGISVNAATGGVSVLGGSAAEATTLVGGPAAFAQIGLGGQGALDSATLTGGAVVAGYVSVVAGGSILVEAGSGISASAQIGNGGRGVAATMVAASADFGGNVTAIAATSISVLGGGTDSAAVIGNGGRYVLGAATLGGGTGLGTVTGDVVVAALGGTLTVAGGGYHAFAQIGDAGRAFGQNLHAGSVHVAGNVTATAASSISVLGGTSTAAFARIGNGGYIALEGAVVTGGVYLTGNVGVMAGGNLAVLGGSGSYASAQIGHGGGRFGYQLNAATLSVSGTITATDASGGSHVLVQGGTGSGAFAQIGHGGSKAFELASISGGAYIGGTIGVSGHSYVGVTGGAGTGAFAQIGNGGATVFAAASLPGGATIAGDISVTAAGDVSLLGGGASQAYVQIGNGGLEGFSRMTGTGGATILGNITVVAGTGVSVVGGSLIGGTSRLASDDYAQIGNGGAHSFESASLSMGGAHIGGNVAVTAQTGDVVVQGGSVLPTPGNSGGYSLSLTDAYAQIGNGGNYSFRGATLTGSTASGIGGNVGVTAHGNVTLAGGYLALQNGFTGATYASGTLSGGNANVGNTLTGSGAQIGHGGADAFSTATVGAGGSTITGSIGVTAETGSVVLTGGSVTRRGSYARGRYSVGATSPGATYISASGSAGQVGYTHGHYSGGTAAGYAFPNIQVLGGYNLAPRAHSNFAQIGNGGAQSFQSATLAGSNLVSGAITVNGYGGVTLTGGNVGASVTNFSFVTTVGGGGSYTSLFAQIGHGGAYFGNGATGTGAMTLMGNIAVTASAGDIFLFAGNGAQADNVQIGHGGYAAFESTTLSGGSLYLSGTIGATASGSIFVLGGGGPYASAQIGHGGGRFAYGLNAGTLGIGGNITVDAGGVVSLTGGSGADSGAQIGHGGEGDLVGATLGGSGLTVSGNITVGAGGSLLVEGGGGNYAEAQIGHGGANMLNGALATSVFVTGNVTATAGSDVSLIGGSGNYSGAQIGHGGYGFARRLAGFPYTSVEVTGIVSVTAMTGYVAVKGGGYASAAQIGHGGYAFLESAQLGNATIGGGIGVYAGSSLTVQGGSSYGAFAQIGHGGAKAFSFSGSTSVTITGDISVGTGSFSDITVQGGSGSAADAQIGHGGFDAFAHAYSKANLAGSITVTSGGNLFVSGGGYAGSSGQGAFAQIGHGGDQSFRNMVNGSSVTLTGNVGAYVAGNLVMSGGIDMMDAYAQIGHGGAQSFRGFGGTGGPDGNITVQVGGNATLTGGTGEDDYVQIGHGGAKQGKRAGSYGGSVGSFTNSGSIGVTVGYSGLPGTGTLKLTGGSTDAGGTGNNSYVLIGHGGDEFFGESTLALGTTLENSGNIAVTASQAVLVQGGSAGDSFVQVGNGGTGELGGHGSASGQNIAIVNAGDINVTVGTSSLAGTLSLTGGNGALAYALIGDGGPMTPPGVTGTFATFADVTNSGNITVSVGAGSTALAGSTLALQGGSGSNPLDLNKNGPPLLFFGGAFAQIGNGGAGASPTTGAVQDTGDITVQVGKAGGSTGNISLTGANNTTEQANGATNYAQIGNGGAGGLEGTTLTGTSTVSGTVTVGASGSIALQAGTVSGTSGGTFDAGYVQIGHGGAGFAANVTGLGSVTVMGDVTVTALGSITLTAGSVTGTDTLRVAYAQIGNGGQGIFVSFPHTTGQPALTGNVEVQAGGDVSLTGSFARAYAQIGNGDAALTDMGGFTNFSAAFMTGDIDVRAGGTLSLASGGRNEFIGDLINLSTGPGGIPNFVIIEAGTFMDGGVAGINAELAGIISSDLGNSNVSVLAANSDLTLNNHIGNTSLPTGTLNLVSVDSVVLDASIATNGTVNVIAGWDGSALPVLSAGDFDAAAVLSSPTHYGSSGHTIGLLADVTIDTTGSNTGSGGNINLAGTVNDNGGQRTDALTLIAGTGNVSFGAVGQAASGQPREFVIESAHNVSETVLDSGGTPTAAFQAGGLDIVTATGTVGFVGSIFTGGLPGVLPNGGAVTINAAGAVSIGPSGGSTLFSIDTGGAFEIISGQTAGNGGPVSIAASSITVSHGIRTFGGGDIANGSTGAAGNGGAVSLTALGGFIQIGQGGVFNQSIAAEGGDSQLGATGPGGAGGTIIAEAQTVTFSGGAYSFGGRSTTAGSTGGGGLGAPITVTALSGPVTIGAGSAGQSIDSVGGYSALGSNANAGAISVFGNGISVAGSVFSFGKVLAGSSASGSAGGAIALNAGTGTLSIGAGGFALLSAGGYSSGGNGAGGAINLTASTILLTSGSPVTIDPGSGTLSVSGSVGGIASLALLGTSSDEFGGALDIGAGTLDLSNKTAGSVTVTGFLGAGGLATGTNPVSISLLGGGVIGDPNFQNSGTNTFAGNFVFTGGLTIGALTLAGSTSFDTATSGITLGQVTQGTDTFIVIADSVTLNGDWVGTGNRFISPFTGNAPIVLGTSAAGFFLDQTALNHLSGGPSGDGARVVIGSGLSGSVTATSFSFNDPLTLIGSAITINGTLSKSTGGLALLAEQCSVNLCASGSLSLGEILGSVSLALGTGEFTWEGHDGTLTNTTINGDPGTTNSILNFVTLVPGSKPGPFIIDGFTESLSQGGGGGIQQSISQSGGSGAITSLLQNNNNPNNNPNTNTTVNQIVLIIQQSPGSTGSTSSGTPSNGDGTTADDAAGALGTGSTGTPTDTPSSSGNSKPIVPNLFLHTNNGLSGGTGDSDNGGTLDDPPSM